MITHFLGRYEVRAYSRDFARRLVNLDVKVPSLLPTLWCALGQSGFKMATTILEQLAAIGHQSIVDKIEIAVAQYDRAANSIVFVDPPEAFKARDALVIDSAVHSGRSMAALVTELRKLNVASTLTYGLILKSGSTIVPNFFGVIIDDKDRTYFELPEIPNNRLHNQKPPIGTLRKIDEDDIHKDLGIVGAPFDGITMGDLIYDRDANSSKVYCFENNDEIMGFVSFRKKASTIFIDALATVKKYRDMGVGGALLRWAETWARSQKCTTIEFWAYEPAIHTYTSHNYEFVDEVWRDLGNGRRYRMMRKSILYNILVTQGEEFFVSG